MERLRFIHAADLHLDSPFKGMENEIPQDLFTRMKESTFRSFSRIVQVAIEEKVDFILLAGDLYDLETRSLRAQLFLRNEFQLLDEHRIPVYIIHGNHDHLGGHFAEMKFPPNVAVFEKDRVEYKPFYKNNQLLAYIYGFSYLQQAVLENMTSQYEKTEQAPYHIGMLHGSVEEASDHSRYAPFLVRELLDKQFHYWALGHIHKRNVLNEQPPIIYSGNIQGRHRKETGEKGCYLVTLEGSSASHTFIPTADVIWEEASISIEGLQHVDELLARSYSMKNELRRKDEGTLVVLTFTGCGELSTYLQDQKQLEELVQQLQTEETGEQFVYVVKCYNHTLSNDALETMKQESHFIGELLQEVESYSYLDSIMRPLRQPASAKGIEEFTEEEKDEIVQEAKRIILRELVAERGDMQ
ncbi:metallophosphoesterase family protein [Ectobacillus polymachus]|uniref:metallophosphoesterase family protein n=1 Tax=Ectobacillus polymachus TaxID=1508806 RepID=UPI003A83D6AD